VNSIETQAGVLSSLANGAQSMTGTLYVPETQQGSVALKITQMNFDLYRTGTAGEYTLYAGSETVSNVQNALAGVSFGSSSSRTVKTKLFSEGV
jgi:hypothetical protein